MQLRISDAALRGLKPRPGQRLEIWDTTVSGLCVRCSNSGDVSWSVRARLTDGRRTRVSLGGWPAIGVKSARKAALAVLADVTRGRDPTGDKRANRAAALARKKALTVSMALDRWQAAKTERWTPRTAEGVASTIRLGIPPALCKRPLDEVRRADWIAIIELARPRGAGAVRSLYSAISAFLSYAEAAGLIEQHPLPRRGAAMFAPLSRPRERSLTDQELVRVWNAAACLGPYACCFARLLILTGARRSEVAGIVCGEINLEAAIWRIPGSRAKNRVTRQIALGPLALAELRAVWPPDCTVANNRRLLAQRGGAALSDFSMRKRRLDATAGVSDWCWHDLRRVFRSGLARLRVPDGVAEAALGHVSGRPPLARVYDRHDRSAEAAAALLAWQAHVAQLISQPDADIVQFPPAA
jgi:integrase